MKKALWWILLLIVLVVLAVIYRPGKNSGVKDVNVNINNGELSNNPEAAEGAANNNTNSAGNTIPAKVITDADKEVLSESDEALAANTEGFVKYDSPEVQVALADGKRVALFFHADWCPSCRALSKDIQKNLATIDENTLIYQVDYDTEVALKQKYGVTSQHTIVYLDENMEAEKISRGIPTLEQLLANFSS